VHSNYGEIQGLYTQDEEVFATIIAPESDPGIRRANTYPVPVPSPVLDHPPVSCPVLLRLSSAVIFLGSLSDSHRPCMRHIL